MLINKRELDILFIYHEYFGNEYCSVDTFLSQAAMLSTFILKSEIYEMKRRLLFLTDGEEIKPALSYDEVAYMLDNDNANLAALDATITGD